MKVLFCTRLFDMNKYSEYCDKVGYNLSLADSNLIHSFVRGLDENLGEPVSIVNVTPIPTFPHYPELIVRNKVWHHVKDSNDFECGYVNLPIVKQYTRKISIYKNLKKMISSVDEDICIITYDLHLEVCKAIKKIKTINPKIKTTVILPDIPEQMKAVRGIKKGSLLDVYVKKQMESIDQFDSYVFITEHMRKYVSDKTKPFVVIEGMWSGMSNSEVFCEQKKDGNHVVFYSGLLSNGYGIKELIKSMEMLNQTSKQYELWVCGAGQLRKFVEDKASEHSYIKYFGYVDTQTILDLQKQVTVLINPRSNEGNFTKYSFPSKTISYLASGKPVLAYKLDCIPNEYDKYLIYIKPFGDKVSNIADAIKSICSLNGEERKVLGQRNRNFIEKNKVAGIMCKRIIDMWSK